MTVYTTDHELLLNCTPTFLSYFLTHFSGTFLFILTHKFSLFILAVFPNLAVFRKCTSKRGKILRSNQCPLWMWPFWDPCQTMQAGSLWELLHSAPGAWLYCSVFWMQENTAGQKTKFSLSGKSHQHLENLFGTMVDFESYKNAPFIFFQVSILLEACYSVFTISVTVTMTMIWLHCISKNRCVNSYL